MFMCRKMKRGQSMVELALMLPALAVVLVLVADFARAYYASIGVASAARAGVQYGTQNYTTAIDFYSIRQAALNDGQTISGLSAEASDFCMCNGSTVACSPAQCAEPQPYVKVKTTTTFNTLLSYPGLPTQFPLTSTAVMEVQ